MSVVEIFEQFSQIIVQSRITPSEHDGISNKDFGDLQLQEWETVRVAIERRSRQPTTRGWKGITLEIKLNLHGDEAEPVEQWYFGINGQPKLSRRQVNAMFKSLYTHLRILPLYWLKCKSLPPLDLSFNIYGGPPQRPISSTHKEVAELGDSRTGGFKLVYYHLPNIADIIHATRVGRFGDFGGQVHSTQLGIHADVPSQSGIGPERGRIRAGSGSGPRLQPAYESPEQLRNRSGSDSFDKRPSAQSLARSPDYHSHGRSGPMSISAKTPPPDIQGRVQDRSTPPCQDGQQGYTSVSGPKGLMTGTDPDRSFERFQSGAQLPDGAVAGRKKSQPVDIPSHRSTARIVGDRTARGSYRKTAPVEYYRGSPNSCRAGQDATAKRFEGNGQPAPGSLPSHLRGSPARQLQVHRLDADFPFAPASFGSKENFSNRSPSDRHGISLSSGAVQRTPQSFGSAGSSNLRISYLHGGNSPSWSSLSGSRLSLHSNDDGSLGSQHDPEDDLCMMDENRHDIVEDLPFAMDDGDELSSFVEQFKQAPMSLSMFNSKLDIVQSVAHLDDDLQASRSELAMFDMETRGT